MKKVLLFSMTLLLLLGMLLSSCTIGTPDTENTEMGAGNDVATLQIGGVDISEYSIIYAESEMADMLSIVGTQYDYDKVTATRLSDLIFDRFGVRLEVKCDADAKKPADYEILVGETNREESKSARIRKLAVDDYAVELSGKKLVVCGGAYGTTYHAVDSIEAWFGSAVENSLYNLTESVTLSGSYHLKRIACIGDSITAGSQATDRELFSYPAYLGRMYWQEGLVYQYGNSGKTMSANLSDSYMATQEWKDCIGKAFAYDAVLIMLGTNDSNRVYKQGNGWTAAANNSFMESCRTLCARLKTHSPNAELVIMNCPVTYRADYEALQPQVLQAQSEIVDILKESGYNIHLFDMHSFSEKEIGHDYFLDNLHPINQGYVKMATILKTTLGHLFAGETSEYLLN